MKMRGRELILTDGRKGKGHSMEEEKMGRERKDGQGERRPGSRWGRERDGMGKIYEEMVKG